MPYKFIEDIAVADVAFEASNKTASGMFQEAGMAVTRTMVKSISSVKQKEVRKIEVEDGKVDMLLFKFLQEIVFYKDAESLLFSRYMVKISPDMRKLTCNAYGEKIDPKAHEMLVDVKAVTLHRFEVQNDEKGWRCFVILDI
ncbi:MAG: archease [Candidatus Aenigmarchaeota archaeon]|nr:archease [Candidatus Aenigmarchaeota archaeon]